MADVDLTVTIPDAWVDRVLTAISNFAGNKIEIRIDGVSLEFSYAQKGAGESNIEFGKRWLRNLGLYFVKVSELKTDVIRYNNEAAAISEPNQSVPSNIFQ